MGDCARRNPIVKGSAGGLGASVDNNGTDDTVCIPIQEGGIEPPTSISLRSIRGAAQPACSTYTQKYIRVSVNQYDDSGGVCAIATSGNGRPFR